MYRYLEHNAGQSKGLGIWVWMVCVCVCVFVGTLGGVVQFFVEKFRLGFIVYINVKSCFSDYKM